jgi:polyhydroxyalkanoate synthesis regulator phasin
MARKHSRTVHKLIDRAGETIERAKADQSKQPRFTPNAKTASQFFNQIYGFVKGAIFDEPPYVANSTKRDTWLAKVVLKEPYLLGVLQSVVSIDKNRGWTLTGGRNQVTKFTNILHNFQVAPDLYGWRNGMSVTSQSYYQSDLGGVVEIGRSQKNGPLAALYSVDPTKCFLTGKLDAPLQYTNAQKDKQQWMPNDYFRVVSFPNPNEAMQGLGYCAISRCIELAKLLVSVFEHDRERLGSKAPKGILTINGLTQEQWLRSLEESDAERSVLEREYYSGVQVLAGDALSPVTVALTSLSNLPEQFEHKQFVEMMIFGYALAFGYDPREFYPVSSGALGTATETESQHRKATSKGGLDYALSYQEKLQEELPETINFEFEQRDVEGDISETTFQQAKLNVIDQMVKGGEITIEESRQLLVEAEIIPEEWTVQEEEVTTTDTDDEGELLEKSRIKRAIEKFPHEDIVSYSSVTGITRTLRKAGQPKRFMLRVAKPVIQAPPAPVIDTDKLLSEIDARFAQLQRETPAPAPVINVQSENPSILGAILGRLSQPKEDKQNERELRGVAEALNNLARSQPAPAPNFSVMMPAINISAQMPAQEQPAITFSPNIKASDVVIRENAPVNVTVQPAPAAVNQITIEPAINQITVQPADVIMPLAPKKAVITTAKDGTKTLEVE